MPFTFAHPAIILPLKYLPKKWISLSALVVGSVIPDAEAYLRMYSEKEHSHSWAGFFMFGFPFGLLMTFVFHNVVRNPLIDHLPSFLYRRFAVFKSFNWNKRFVANWPAVMGSLIIGGSSHFFWDSFSDFNGWLLRMYPQLSGEIVVGGRELEIPFVIQYISTLLGIIVMLFFIPPPKNSHNVVGALTLIKFWGLVVVVATMIFIPRRIRWPVNSIDDLTIAIISAFILALILVCLVFERGRSGA